MKLRAEGRILTQVAGRIGVVALCLILAACAGAQRDEGRASMTAVGFADLPGWQDDDPNGAFTAFQAGCKRLKWRKPEKSMGGVGGKAAAWLPICQASLDAPASIDARTFFETWFQPYKLADEGQDTGLFTGYFEAELEGSLTRGGAYQTPLYARPPELVMVDLGQFRQDLKGRRIAGRVVDGQLKPFDDRTEIEAGSLDGRGLELVWVNDPAAAFFMHIQGSGRIRLTDGSIKRLGYDGVNGHVYFAIGKKLIADGHVAKEDMSMQAILDWMADNPQEAPALMNTNPSYVFFRELDIQDPNIGPVGAMGVALTPGRSLAVDKKFIPLGAPLWIDTTDPLTEGSALQRLVIAQDTGGAIRGVVRGDLFTGAGASAEKLAGPMKQAGEMYILLPRGMQPTS